MYTAEPFSWNHRRSSCILSRLEPRIRVRYVNPFIVEPGESHLTKICKWITAREWWNDMLWWCRHFTFIWKGNLNLMNSNLMNLQKYENKILVHKLELYLLICRSKAAFIIKPTSISICNRNLEYCLGTVASNYKVRVPQLYCRLRMIRIQYAWIPGVKWARNDTESFIWTPISSTWINLSTIARISTHLNLLPSAFTPHYDKGRLFLTLPSLRLITTALALEIRATLLLDAGAPPYDGVDSACWLKPRTAAAEPRPSRATRAANWSRQRSHIELTTRAASDDPSACDTGAGIRSCCGTHSWQIRSGSFGLSLSFYKGLR